MKFGLTTRDSWNPTRELSPWFREFDDMLDKVFVPMTAWRKDNVQMFNPACDIKETGTHYLMSVDLPGVSKDDVKIEVIDNQLTIAGERRVEKEDDKDLRHVTERFYGSFKRAFTLPSSIDAAKVEANFKDGVLQIALPKSEEARPYQVKISG